MLARTRSVTSPPCLDAADELCDLRSKPRPGDEQHAWGTLMCCAGAALSRARRPSSADRAARLPVRTCAAMRMANARCRDLNDRRNGPLECCGGTRPRAPCGYAYAGLGGET
jgi:hypothetical protein